MADTLGSGNGPARLRMHNGSGSKSGARGASKPSTGGRACVGGVLADGAPPVREELSVDRRSLLTVATGAVGAVAASRIPASAARPAQPGPAAQSGPAHPGPGSPVTTFNVISDIQGDLRDLGVALEDMNRTNRASSGLAVAGDITPRGYDAEYAAVGSEVSRHTHARTVAWAIGNHEFYVPKWRDPSTLARDVGPTAPPRTRCSGASTTSQAATRCTRSTRSAAFRC